MASVDGITVVEAQRIENASVHTGYIDPNGYLQLVTVGGTEITAGQVADYAALSTHAALSHDTHGLTGAGNTFVGLTGDQTLTNKTLAQPTIADFINAQHSHNGASQGGGLYIGKADSPAPVTTLTAVTLSDGDAAKTMASLSCPAGKWLILATCEGVNLGSGGTLTRFSFDLKSTQPTFVAKAVSGSSSVATVDAGRSMFGWLDITATATVTFTLVKNGTGGPTVTNSTTGALVAIRMG